MSITDRETLDKETAESLERGLQQSANGQTVSRGSFAQFAEDEPNRWEPAGKIVPGDEHYLREYRDTL